MGDVRFLAWCDEFAVGHPALDSEHHALVDSINTIHAAENAKHPPIQVNVLLDALMQQTVEHFHHEDVALRAILKRPLPDGNRLAFVGLVATAAFDQHILSHKHTIRGLGSIIHRRSAEGSDVSLKLRDWFINHAVKHDGHLKPVFRVLNR